ncbi:MAG TPA: trypsin-like peptidase domain-containing protein [Casimicrobiaceae bacterium]|nr:trypsin-like peptidase domain-containing protein [Casimicrobiaceae bacterium]
MRSAPLYSRSGRRPRGADLPAAGGPPSASAPAPAEPGPAAPAPPAPRRGARLAALTHRFERPLLVALGTLLALGAMLAYGTLQPSMRPLTQKDIDAAVMHTLENNVLPSQAAQAFAKIEKSVVRVRDLATDKDNKEIETGVGTGVVIVDKGVILTNLHVVLGAKKVGVVFADGTESEATVVGAQPENDLAVLQAKTLPDDLQAATMRSTADLVPGDRVIAVGFPFGIGPSVSDGVISGLRREYRSPEGKRLLTNLIQFDAAANPGNSGGPLVTMDGEVVGIVTGILNPTSQRVFIGIGFAVPIENAAAAAGLSPF